MPNREAFPAVFSRLKATLEPYTPHLLVTEDEPASYMLYALASTKYPKGLMFGGVQIKKNYVSHHPMPVYAFPDLLDGLSEPLRQRMQGKSCFNFTAITAIDDGPMAELEALTARGFERYRRGGVA